LFFRGAPFALEEATRDFAGGESLFLVIDREREKILSRLGLLGANRRAQHRGLAIGRHHGAIGLPCDPAGLEHEAAAAPHQLFAKHLEHCSSLSSLSSATHAGAARATPR